MMWIHANLNNLQKFYEKYSNKTMQKKEEEESQLSKFPVSKLNFTHRIQTRTSMLNWFKMKDGLFIATAFPTSFWAVHV